MPFADLMMSLGPFPLLGPVAIPIVAPVLLAGVKAIAPPSDPGWPEGPPSTLTSVDRACDGRHAPSGGQTAGEMPLKNLFNNP